MKRPVLAWRRLATAGMWLAALPVAVVLGRMPFLAVLPLCPFRAVTGKPCIFCGLCRALACAAQGEYRRATAYHPLWWLAALAIVSLAVISAVDVPRESRGARLRLGRRGRTGWLLVASLLLGSLLRAAIWPLPP